MHVLSLALTWGTIRDGRGGVMDLVALAHPGL